MKDYHKVQRDRIKYHAQPSKDTVHRSSLIASEIPLKKPGILLSEIKLFTPSM